MSSPKFYSPTHSQSEMLGHIPTMEGNLGHENEREGGMDQNESLCEKWEREPVEPLLLLIQVTQVNGRPLSIGSFTARAIVSVVQKQTGYHPVDVEVMSDRDAIEWDGQLAEIGCLLFTHRSVVNIVQERENGCARLQQLEDEQRQVSEEQ